MNLALRLVIAVVLGCLAGGLLNGAVIALGPSLIPPPVGVDMTTVEGLRAGMPLLEPRHFVMPFLAHALGTLVGALVGALLVPAKRKVAAYAIGVLFLVGGIAATVMIPAPTWFKAVDLTLAYLPMAWLALVIAGRKFGALSTTEVR